MIKKIFKILILSFVWFNITMFIYLYYLSYDNNNNCMYEYVKSDRFWIDTWYIEDLQPWLHIDYMKMWKVIGYCKGCKCTDIVSSYQCNTNKIIYFIRMLF